MTPAAILLCLSLALLAPSTPLTLPTLNLTTPLLPPTTPTLTAKAHCFIQPHHPGAPHLFDTSIHECRAALTFLVDGKPPNTPYTFSRHPSADVRLPYAKAFRTCKIIIDIMDEVESERLTWGGIQETLEAPKGVLRNCLGQGILPPLGGRTSVGEKGAMQAVVVGQAWKGGAGAVG